MERENGVPTQLEQRPALLLVFRMEWMGCPTLILKIPKREEEEEKSLEKKKKKKYAHENSERQDLRLERSAQHFHDLMSSSKM